MTPSVSVITATIPGREFMLAECKASIEAQTVQPLEHIVELDAERTGCAATMNRMLERVAGDWVAWLADDDVAYPEHLETLLSVSQAADIVYSWCDVEGRGGWNPNAYFDAERLVRENFIPATALIRTSLALELGGWKTNAAYGWEDWDFWKRALAAGARFKCVPRRTWKYRFHGGNASA